MKEQKRISLTHGTARVDKNCSKETIEALDQMSKLAYNMEKNGKIKGKKYYYMHSNREMNEKRCNECRKVKELKDFFRNFDNKDNLESNCKSCITGVHIKKCSFCLKDKGVGEFEKAKRRGDGLSCRCADCKGLTKEKKEVIHPPPEISIISSEELAIRELSGLRDYHQHKVDIYNKVLEIFEEK